MTRLEAVAVGKRYGATVALEGVDFNARAGAVNVLIGENGAGKSTLMRILAGVEQPSAGQLRLDGEPIRFPSVQAATRCGVAIVHQELNLCPNLTVAENIFLGRERTRGGRLDRAAERAQARAILDRLDARIDPDAPVDTLKIGQQQMVEIARALSEDARVLILDEPTSALGAADVETLFRRDGVAVVYISHRLEELMRIGDHVTVLRDGRLQASAPAADVSVDWIVEQMLGETADRRARTPRPAGSAAPVLKVADAVVERPGGGRVLDGVSVAFAAGEVTAVYGLLGAGRTELLEFVAGLSFGTGAVRLGKQDLTDLPLAERVARGVLLVPEDRQRDGLFANLSVGANLDLAHLSALQRRGYLSPKAEERSGGAMLHRLGVKAAGLDAPIHALSGGNQQKVVIGRCLMCAPAALLLDEPSRGVDVGARADVFETLASLADEGIAVVFATSDLDEALGFADRIVVLSNGRLTADLGAAQADRPALVRAANLAA